MPESPAEQAVTELKLAISKFDLKFGHLVVVTLPESVVAETDPILTRMNNWWITQAPYFRGAKILFLKNGTSLAVEGVQGLRKLGYIGLQDTVGNTTVSEILQQHMAKHGVTDENVGVPLHRTADPREGERRHQSGAEAAAAHQ